MTKNQHDRALWQAGHYLQQTGEPVCVYWNGKQIILTRTTQMKKQPEYKIVEIDYPGNLRKQYKIKIKKRFLEIFSYWTWIYEEDEDVYTGEYRMKIFNNVLAAHDFMIHNYKQ